METHNIHPSVLIHKTPIGDVHPDPANANTDHDIPGLMAALVFTTTPPNDDSLTAKITPGAAAPQWAIDWLTQWRDILYLNSWGISMDLEAMTGGESDTTAYVNLYPNVLIACMKIKESIPQTLAGLPPERVDYWRKVIIHELLHVYLGRVTDFVDHILVSELSRSAYTIALSTFTREVEPAVELMSHILYELWKKQDGNQSLGSPTLGN